MTTIIINPGSGFVHGATLENAKKNIKKYIEDCNIEGLILNNKEVIDNGDGRYVFELIKGDKTCEIKMPGLPLEQVRYMQKAGQNIWDFPRLYVDGGSWVWCFGLIDEEYFEEKE